MNLYIWKKERLIVITFYARRQSLGSSNQMLDKLPFNAGQLSVSLHILQNTPNCQTGAKVCSKQMTLSPTRKGSQLPREKIVLSIYNPSRPVFPGRVELDSDMGTLLSTGSNISMNLTTLKDH